MHILFLENLLCMGYGKCHSKHEVQNGCEMSVFMHSHTHAPASKKHMDGFLCSGDLSSTSASIRVCFKIIQFNLHLGLLYVPAESLFPGEERGIWPHASDVQISTATDADVRKSPAKGFGACAGHLCSPCTHISIQEMIHKTRANPAPCPYPIEYKYTKGKPICS